MEPFRSLRTFGLAVMILIGLNGALSMVAIPISVSQLELLDRVEVGNYTEDELATSDAVSGGLGILTFVLYVVTGCVYIAWFHRAYGNTRAFGHEPLHGTGWAIGSWFTPILSLFRPYQIAREIWSASDPDRDAAVVVDQNPPMLVAWWALWLIGQVVGQISFRLAMNADDIGSLRGSTTAQTVADVVNIATVPFAILVVREITRRQEESASRAMSPDRLAELERTFE